MRNFKISLLFSAFVLLIAFGCKKNAEDSIPMSEQTSTERTVLDCTSVKNAVSQSDGMLVFSDEHHFEACIECLEQELEAYNDSYESQYPTATAEQLDVLDSITILTNGNHL